MLWPFGLGVVHQKAATLGWSTSDYTAMASTSAVGAAGTPLAAYLNSPSECFFYVGTDSHVYELLWNGSSMSNLDLTALSGARRP